MTKVATPDDKQDVTAVISHLVKSGKEQHYEQWLRSISAVAQEFEGHSGVSFIRPEDPSHPEYAIILKFDCYKNLKRWMESPVRHHWLGKAKSLVQKDQKVRILTGLEAWFTLPGKPMQQPPKRYKMVMLTTLPVFVISQLLRYWLDSWFTLLPSLAREFFFTTVTVLLLTYAVMPRVTHLFYGWLYPKTKRKRV